MSDLLARAYGILKGVVSPSYIKKELLDRKLNAASRDKNLTDDAIKQILIDEIGKKNKNMGGKLENPEKADLNKDGKLSKYEKTRGKAIEKNIKKDKINKRYGGKVRTPSNFGL
jgi:hypothetical protein